MLPAFRRAARLPLRPQALAVQRRFCARELYNAQTVELQESAASTAVLAEDQEEAAIAEWWHTAAVAPKVGEALELEHDVPRFFLRHDKLLQEFKRYLGERPATLRAMRSSLLVPPAMAISARRAATANDMVSPFLSAVAAFVQDSYPSELAGYRRARHLADLRQPQSWFPAARRLQRRWQMHLGPTNSGKTHSAAKRLLSAASGVYMSPLRLLAWEMYEKMCNAGLRCALRTGQEQLGPEDATHIACTIEMAPLSVRVDVGVVDEVQMVVHESRGAAWTRALLGVQAKELHLCGSAEPLGLPQLLRGLALDCGDEISAERHERKVPLIAESKALRDLAGIRAGDCVICFTRMDVLLTKAELERLGHSVCVIYGALPPEVRREQAAATC